MTVLGSGDMPGGFVSMCFRYECCFRSFGVGFTHDRYLKFFRCVGWLWLCRYELLKKTNLKGMSLVLVRMFTKQVLIFGRIDTRCQFSKADCGMECVVSYINETRCCKTEIQVVPAGFSE